jgi:hypothetical protein
MLLLPFFVFPKPVVQFEAEFDANPIAPLHQSFQHDDTVAKHNQHDVTKTHTKKHKLFTSEGRLPDWFIKDTARDT